MAIYKYFYTGASTFLGAQNRPSLSLGGYLSNTVVPNSIPNNLFPDVSYYGIERDIQHTIGIGLLKTDAGAGSNINIYMEVPANNFCTFELAAVAFTMDVSQTVLTMENLNSPQSSPYYATFLDITGISNIRVIQLSALSAFGGPYGLYYGLGLWIRRKIKPGLLASNYDDDVLKAQFANPTIPLKEDIKLKIIYT